MEPVFPVGVTVIKEYTYNPPGRLIFMIFIFIFLTSAIIITLANTKENTKKNAKPYFIISIISAFCLIGLFIFPKTSAPIKIYKVAIDDSVKFNEIYDKYEVTSDITSTNDNVYTLQEKGT